MHSDKLQYPETRPLELIFKAHIENSVACCKILNMLFSHLDDPLPYIARIKQLEEAGDNLTGEAYYALESYAYTSIIYTIEDLVKRLDDIVDGFNKTARLIDIFQTKYIESAALDILSRQQAMLDRLQHEINKYPDNGLESLSECRSMLKIDEETVDLIYHEWRKKERRVLQLALIEESNWTEIFNVLEQTTDDIYHTAIVLEKITRHRLKSSAFQDMN